MGSASFLRSCHTHKEALLLTILSCPLFSPSCALSGKIGSFTDCAHANVLRLSCLGTGRLRYKAESLMALCLVLVQWHNLLQRQGPIGTTVAAFQSSINRRFRQQAPHIPTKHQSSAADSCTPVCTCLPTCVLHSLLCLELRSFPGSPYTSCRHVCPSKGSSAHTCQAALQLQGTLQFHWLNRNG